MIVYNTYQREDGITCTGVQFHGNAYNETPEHVFEVLEILNAAGLKAFWADAVETDEWLMKEDPRVPGLSYPVLDENFDPIKKVIPEHIELEASKDKMFVGDYIVMRDGETYIQDGRTFEAVWSLIDTTLTDLGEFLQSRKEIEQ